MIIILGILVAFVVLGYQVFRWLQTGIWQPLPAMVLLVHLLPERFFAWLGDGTSWVGFKKIILGICELPLSLFLFLICVLLFFFFESAISEMKDIAKPKKSADNLNKPDNTSEEGFNKYGERIGMTDEEYRQLRKH